MFNQGIFVPSNNMVGGFVGGSGTLNYIAKWTPNGVTIGNSLLFDNGTNVGLGTATPAGRFNIVHVTSGSVEFNDNGHFKNSYNANNYMEYIPASGTPLTMYTTTATISGFKAINMASNFILQCGNGAQALLTTDYFDMYIAGAGVPTVRFNSSQQIGFGTGAGTIGARINVQGLGSTNATYTAIFQNSSLVQSLVVRNDGSVYNLGAGSVSGNTAFGDQAFISNVTGTYSTAFGFAALALTTADFNTAFGYRALAVNTTGTDNVAIGAGALVSNVSGNYNIGIGHHALESNVSGVWNIAIGKDSLDLNVSDYNVAIGGGSLQNNTNGTKNISIGFQTMIYNIDGNYCVSVGSSAGYSNTHGVGNVNIGQNAGFSNATGNYSVNIGFGAGYYETVDSKLFIDNAPRSSEADGRAKALIYGVFAAATANQYLAFNAGKINVQYVQVGTSVDLVSGDLYFDAAATITANGDLFCARKV